MAEQTLLNSIIWESFVLKCYFQISLYTDLQKRFPVRFLYVYLFLSWATVRWYIKGVTILLSYPECETENVFNILILARVGTCSIIYLNSEVSIFYLNVHWISFQ